MRRLGLALLACLLLSGQAMLPGFPPGLFSNRVALTGGGGASLSCSYTPVTSATYNVPYTGATPSPSGGSGSYTSYANTGSSLPPGITLNTSTGVLSGTDSTDSGGATYPGIQLQVTDSLSNTANCGTSFTITVGTGAPLANLDGSTNCYSLTAAAATVCTLSTTKTNDIIIVHVQHQNTGGIAVSGIADTAGLSWSVRKTFGSVQLEEWYAKSSGVLTSDTITITYNTSVGNDYPSANVFGVNQANYASPFDGNAAIPSSGSPTCTFTTSNANDFLIAAQKSPATVAAGSGFTIIASNATYIGSQYKIVTSTQSGSSGAFAVNGVGEICDALVSN